MTTFKSSNNFATAFKAEVNKHYPALIELAGKSFLIDEFNKHLVKLKANPNHDRMAKIRRQYIKLGMYPGVTF